MPLVIGLELDETRVLAAAVDDRGAVQARAAVGAAGDLAGAARAALRQIGVTGTAAMAIGVASPVPEAAAVTSAVAALGREFGAVAPGGPVASGTAAAMAEAWVGAAKGARNLVWFAASDRTSAGILRDGAPMTGAHGRAPIASWLALNPVEREDYRKTGCLEAEVAAAGIVRRLVWRIKAGDESVLQDDVRADVSAVTVDRVLDAARGGDGVASAVVRDTVRYLGMAAANLVLIIDPDVLVLGGTIASAADVLFEPVRSELGRRLPRAVLDALTVAPAALGADAAAIGAARMATAALP